MKYWKIITSIGLTTCLLSGCSTFMANTGPALNLHANWALLPSINNTDTPQAGGRLDSITASVLRIHGVDHLTTIQAPTQSSGALFEVADRDHQNAALEQARKQGAQYAVMASVNEWRYKVGLDGEPAVGISIEVTDVATNQVIWSGTTARSGWSRQAVSDIAQKSVNKLLSDALAHAK
jgi:PBP1b-binding outer membrane lipoprotein LpoB